MLTPEADFTSWISAFVSNLDNPEGLPYYVEHFGQVVKDLRAGINLQSKYHIITEKFYDFINQHILTKILSNDKLNLDKYPVYKDLLFKFVDLIRVEADTHYIQLVDLISIIFTQENALFKTNDKLFLQIQNRLKENGDFTYYCSKIDKMELESLSIFTKFGFIILFLYNHEENSKISTQILNQAYTKMSEQMRGNVIPFIEQITENYMKIAKIKKIYFPDTITILYKIISCEFSSIIHLHHINGINLLIKTLALEIDRNTHQKYLNEYKILTNLFKIQFKKENMKDITLLFSKLTISGYLTPYIDEFWSISKEDSFFDLFKIVYHFSKQNDQNLHLEHFVKLEKTQKWVEIANYLCNHQKNKENATSKILQSMNETPLQENYLIAFQLKLLGETITEKQFNEYIDDFIKHNKVPEIDCNYLQILLTKYIIIDKVKVSKFLLLLCHTYLDSKHDQLTVAKCIILVFTKQGYPVNPEVISILIKYASELNDSQIFLLIENNIEIITKNVVLTALTKNYKNVTTSSSLINFIKDLFFTKTLDLDFFYILWIFACKDSTFRADFVKYLLEQCVGETTHVIIQFLSVCFERDLLEEGCLDLMFNFFSNYLRFMNSIFLMECHASYEELSCQTVSIKFNNNKPLSLILPKFTYLSSIIITVSNFYKLDIKSFTLMNNGKPVDPNSILKIYKNPNSVISEFEVNANMPSNDSLIEMQYFPDHFIIEPDAFNLFIENLCDKMQFKLLKLIRVPDFYIDKLAECTDISKILPKDNIILYRYNLIIISSHKFSSRMSKYLFEKLPEYILESLQIQNVELQKNLLIYCYTIIDRMDQKKLFEILMTLPLSLAQHISIIINRMKPENIDKKSLIYSLAMNDSEDASFFVLCLKNFAVDIQDYIDVILKIDKNPSNYLIFSMMQHIIQPTEKLVPVLAKLTNAPSCSIQAAEFIALMSKQNFLTTETKQMIANYIIFNIFDYKNPIENHIYYVLMQAAQELWQYLNNTLYKLITSAIFTSFRLDGELIRIKQEDSYPGLTNVGNNCFINSTIQALARCGPFTTMMLNNDKFKHPINLQLQNVISKIQMSNLQAIDMTMFCNLWDSTNRLISTIPQDACEFLQEMVNYLEQDLGENEIAKTFSSNIEVCIKGEYKKSISTEKILIMSVNLNSTVFESLKELYKPQNIQYNFDDGRGPVDAVLSKSYSSLPPVFIVQLKRFEYDMQKQKKIKLNDKCDIKKSFNFGGVQYKLNSIVIHHGSIDHGHYTASVRWGSRYFVCNDSVVKKADDFVIDGEPYLLFYSCAEDEFTYLHSIWKKESDINITNLNAKAFLTKPFASIMKKYARQESIDYNKVALKYFFNCSPFYDINFHNELGNLLMESLLTKSKLRLAMLQDFSTYDILNPLLICPYVEVRNSAATLLTVFFSDLHLVDDVYTLFFSTYKFYSQYASNMEEIASVFLSLTKYDDIRAKFIEWKLNLFIETAMFQSSDRINNMAEFIIAMGPTPFVHKKLAEGNCIERLLKNGTSNDVLKRLIECFAKKK